MTLSRTLARQWIALGADAIPASAMDAARLHFLDALGVALAAASLEQGAPYARFAKDVGGPATALTGARMHGAADAALVNGGLMHSLEYDDTHTASIVHGSAVLASAALAVGETACRPLEEVLRSYLLGYEALIRLGLAAQGGFQREGFQVTSVAGALAAAMIAADLYGASEDERVHAAGIALSQASGVFEFLTNGSSVKSMHPGWAAHGGVLAAQLAMSGLTGPESAIEGARGLYASFARDPAAASRFSELMQDFGARWRIADVAFKFLPCCHYLHPFVEAAGRIASQVADPGAIAEMALRIAPGASAIVCEPWSIKVSPADGHAARWSLPVVTAHRIVEGRVDHDTFRARASKAVLDLAARSRWEPLAEHRFPAAFEAEIECRLTDGRRLFERVDDVFGNAARPASRPDILAKFRANASRKLSAASAERLERLFLEPGDGDLSRLRGLVAEA